MRKLNIFVMTFIALFGASEAKADLIYEFDQSNYSVLPGATVDVSVFLTQTGATDVLTTEGLDSIGGKVFFNDPTLPTDPAVVLSESDITSNAAFDDSGLEMTVLDPGISAGIEDSIGTSSSPVMGSSILLGTFRFTAGNVVGEVTNLRATDFDPTVGNDSIVSGTNFTGLDNLLGADATATITVSAVPEPGTATALVMGLVMLSQRRRRL